MKTRPTTFKTGSDALGGGAFARNRQDACSTLEARGLTLLEMLVSVTLLMLIITGLTMMFLQTQKAFRGGLHQVDVFEGGRATMDMIARDVEKLTPSRTFYNTNFISVLSSDYSAITPSYVYVADYSNPSSIVTNVTDTNYFQNIFLLTHGANWAGVSYEVLDFNAPDTVTNVIVGTLYRHVTDGPADNLRGALLYTNFTNFYGVPTNEFQRVIDGIVRFKVRAFDSNGWEFNYTNDFDSTNWSIPDIRLWQEKISSSGNKYKLDGFIHSEFRNNQVPGCLEIELGILEPQAVEMLKLAPTNSASQYYAWQKDFVEKNAGKVHIFRQQIPIRSVNR